MGDRDEANLSYSATHIGELLRCPICLDRFNIPRLLPCQHTFCESPCLEQLVNRWNQIKCPECRIEHRVPYAGVSSFPVNRTLQNFLDIPTQAQPLPLPPVTANQVTGNNQGVGHAENNANNTNNNNHEQREQHDAPSRQNSQQNDSQTTRCSGCSRQQPLSRCSHCDSVICDTCKRSHMDTLRLDITRIVSQLRRGVPSFSDAISLVENKSEMLHQRAEAGKAEITEMVERYISEMRNRQRALHSEVQMWLLGEIRSLRMCQENIEVELASTASFCDSTESTLSRANQMIPDDDLVDIKRQCVEHMEIMRAYEEGNAVRLPRERLVQVTFEGNRFSQAISNFGEFVVVEGQGSDPEGQRSDPPSLNSRSSGSSSREVSPAVQNLRATQEGRGRGQSPRLTTMDRALAAIGSVPAGSQSPRPAPRRGGERMAGLMAGGASGGGEVSSQSDHAPNATGPASSSPGTASRQTPRERLAGLLGGDVPAPQQQQQPRGRGGGRERMAGLMGSGGGDAGTDSTTPRTNRRPPVPPSMSWELPVDFAYPSRTDMRVGNGNDRNTNNNRRSLQERRRHNLSDSRVPLNTRLSEDNNETQSNSRNNRGSGRNVNQSAQNSRQEPVAGPSTEPDRPPISRSRTFTREEFQTIREEDTSSRASTADPAVRPRSPIRFDVDLSNNNGVDGAGYQTGTVDGGESTRVNVAENNYQDKGRAIIRFGGRGGNNSEFIWPRGLAVSRSEKIYVADSSNHRVQVFDNIGTYVKTFGSYGQDTAEFDCLAGITMNTMGEILITDRYNHRIQAFDHQGVFKFKFGEEGQGDGQLSYPWGIATDSMGFIYVCDKENHRVQVFQSSGVFARKFGKLGHQVGQFENPHYLAVSPDNKVYVSDSSNHRIQVFSIYGDFIFSFGSVGTMQGQMKYPKGIAIDEQGFVVVADTGNNRIQVFRGDGRFYCMFGGYGSDSGQFKGLEGLALMSNGNVVVSDRENHRIQIF